jgi:hypothetical protein
LNRREIRLRRRRKIRHVPSLLRLSTLHLATRRASGPAREPPTRSRITPQWPTSAA